MKVLFLDMDGVLCTEKSGARELNRDCVVRLFRIIRETKCSIVITSSWRKSKRLMNKIMAVGIPFIGLTDDLSMPRGFHGAVHRSLEIKIWLKDNKEIERFAILDDERHSYQDEDMTPFFRTSYPLGLTDKIADKVISHLNKI